MISCLRFILTDKDECADAGNVCGNGNCTNGVGTFTCQCEQGFRSGKDSPVCEGKIINFTEDGVTLIM